MQNTLSDFQAEEARFVLIESVHGIGTPTNYQVSYGNTNYAQERIVRIVPRNAVMTNLFYNVTSSTNTILLTTGVEPPVSIVFAPGHYNLTQIQDVINAQLALAGGAYAPVALTGSFVTGFITSTAALPHRYFLAGTSMAERLGLLANTATATAVTFTGVAELNYPTAVYCHMDVAQASTITSGHSIIDLYDVVPINVPWGDVIEHSHNDVALHELTFNDSRNISAIRMRLTDAENVLLECPPGAKNVHMMKIFIAHP